jgi:dTDP-4-dehydrorhamnose reductase
MQKNASVSDTTKDIAMQTQAIADSIVAVTDEKEFDGKHDIKVDSKVSKTNFTKSTSQQINKDTKQLENKKEESAKVVKKPLQNIVASKTNDGDWESF